MPRPQKNGTAQLQFTLYSLEPLPRDFELPGNPFNPGIPRGKQAREYLDSLKVIAYRTEDSGHEQLVFSPMGGHKLPMPAYRYCGVFEIGVQNGEPYCKPVAWTDYRLYVNILALNKTVVRYNPLEESNEVKQPLSKFIDKLGKNQWLAKK